MDDLEFINSLTEEEIDLFRPIENNENMNITIIKQKKKKFITNEEKIIIDK